MARCSTPAQTLNLTPGRLDLCLYDGETDRIDVFLEEDGVLQSLAGWTLVGAAMRPSPDSTPIVDLAPSIVSDIIEIDITGAMKTALGVRYGVWELELIDPTSAPVVLVRGSVTIEQRIGVA